MPGYDGTGPRGEGPQTGGGYGPCSDRENQRYRQGRGRGRGCGPRDGRGLGRGYRGRFQDKDSQEPNRDSD